MSQEQLVELVKRSLSEFSWRGNKLSQITNLKETHNSIYAKKGEEVNLQNLQDLQKYGNHIMAGKTWSAIAKGMLNDEDIYKKIKYFYEKEYSFYLSELQKHETEEKKVKHHAPVWIVEDFGFEKKEVSSMIIEYEDPTNNVIVLLLQE